MKFHKKYNKFLKIRIKNRLQNFKIVIFRKSHKFFQKTLLIYLFSFPHHFIYSETQKIVIKSCYDGDTCTSREGEKIRLACIDTPEIRGKRANPEKAIFVRDYLNDLISGEEVTIRRITYDRYGRTVGELFKDKINLQKHLVDLGLAKVYKKYAYQCKWSNNYFMK